VVQELLDIEDSELARQVRAGSSNAFEELLRRYEDRIFNFIRKSLASREDVEDLTQTIFIKAYRNIKRYNPAMKFETWIFCIARRELISHFRRRGGRIQTQLDFELADQAPNPSGVLAESDRAAVLWNLAAAKLNRKQYDALWLHYREEMSIKEAARVLETSAAAVKVRLHRARNILMKEMSAALPAYKDGEGIKNEMCNI
jgi:RNA polymerase sigma-70 factor, ECF subfamily